MRIKDWECHANPDGSQRGASHQHEGSVIYVGGRLVGNCNLPAEVLEWLLRPLLRAVWKDGFSQATPEYLEPFLDTDDVRAMNPYDGEPPNKDKDPS